MLITSQLGFMKKYILGFIAIACFFSLGCFAQNSHFSVNAKMGNAQLMPDMMSNNDLAVVAYHVEETINMTLGGSTTSYEVSNLNLINTNDLGLNNTRIVTPKYGKVRPKLSAITIIGQSVKMPVAVIPIVAVPIKTDRIPPKYVNINILSTYERVIDKGYKSVEMLKKVANGRYFDNELTIAAKYYSQLFALTSDLAPEYYFRYSQSLRFIGEVEKADEMMAVFKSKN